jgi:hypothetical protein
MSLRTRQPAREEEEGAGGSRAGALMTGDGEQRWRAATGRGGELARG